MKKIVTSSATVLSLAIVSAFAQETETKTATNAITQLAIGKVENIVSSEAQKLEDETLKSISVDLSVNDGEVGGEIT
jgi:HD-like signal output (HDOD) protein